jgi:hypothetical protein
MELEQINSGKIIGYTNEGEQGSPIYQYYLKNPKTGDLYENISSPNYDSEGMISSYNNQPGQLLATGDALKNPDIQNLTNSYNWRGLNNPGEKYADPVEAQNLYNLKQQNPNQYYQKLATDISDQILGNWSMNKNEHNAALTNQLENFKDVSPTAYYQAQLNLLSKQSGWQHGQNTFERAKPYQEKMAELAPKALEAGLSAQQIDSIVGQGFSAASAQNQQRIVNEQQSGGSGFNLGELVRGVAPVAALAVGGPLFSALSAPAAGAATAGGSIGGISLGGAFTPIAGSGASFTLPAAAAAAGAGGSIGGIELGGAFTPTAGSGASFNLPFGAGGSIGGIDLGGAFTPTSGSGANFTIPSAGTSGLMGPTYQELGYTGLEAGQMGPTYAELGYTGLNNAEAIAAADAAAKAASTGLSAKDILSGANQAQKLAKLLTQGGSQVGRNMGVGSMPVANQMAPQPLFEQFGGLYRMNQNPFSFGTQGQSVASPGMYDVSGSNPMANALRKS